MPSILRFHGSMEQTNLIRIVASRKKKAQENILIGDNFVNVSTEAIAIIDLALGLPRAWW